MTSPKALIFDIDGTLWDSVALVGEGYNLQLIDDGHPGLCISEAKLRTLFGKTMVDLADGMLAGLPKEQRMDQMERCMDREMVHLWESPCSIGYPKVKETLAALSEKMDLYIVSNSQRGYPEVCIEKLGLTPYIRGHLCFGDTGAAKSVTIRTLMEKYRIESAAYVGDIQGDCDSAHAAGIPFVWAAYGFGDVKDYEAKIDRFEDLLSLFED